MKQILLLKALLLRSTIFTSIICCLSGLLYAQAPFNDECANAITLPVGVNTCSTLPTTIAGATASPVSVTPCTGAVGYDVWYKFTAISNSSTISISGAGANFTNRYIQAFSGNCGSLTSVACGAKNSALTFTSTTGTTYFIRVYSTDSPAPINNADFKICVNGGVNAPVRFGNSYVNVSKKTNGGVVEQGDTLEIRFTINHTSGTVSKLRYVDNVPSHTSMLTGIKDSIRIITNEGLTYKKFTLASGDDAATYKAAPGSGEYNIRLNLGFGGTNPGIPVNNTSTESASASGSMDGTKTADQRPRGGGGLLFAIAYRVVVTGVAGDTITLFPAQFLYNNGVSDFTLTATSFKILISDPLSLCTNSIGLNNAVENGGTFGNGISLNRGTDLTTPIPGYTFVPNVSPSFTINDGRYAIVKNLSPTSGIQRDASRKPNCTGSGQFDCANRMFNGYWYIDGDHTGTNNAIGNNPPDASTPGGYMMVVNADYVASEVFRQTVTNLCPNTYYEFSAWIRNICPTCGIDSTGAQFAGTPTAPANGYPGVLPNLTFSLDNLDFYNTGEIDTLGWLKRGFVFKTKPGQTTATFSIRNNAQGGGGNDWALDDIAIATCLPTMQYSPSINPFVCMGNALQINDTVRSYFDNYSNFKWQRSTDQGNNWSDITTPVDTTLSYNGTTYQFITKYIIPPANTNMSDSADLYRVVVATTSGNLANQNCLYTDASTIITLSVNDCGKLLGLDLLSFNGKLVNGNADLTWVTANEEGSVYFGIEKSLDGINFTGIATVNGRGNNAANNNYQFTDPSKIKGRAWYRLAIYSDKGTKKYSRTVLLVSESEGISLNNVVNPFGNELNFEVSASGNSRINITLVNISGKQVKQENFFINAGANNLSIPNTGNLAPGIYILQIRDQDKVLSKKVLKQ